MFTSVLKNLAQQNNDACFCFYLQDSHSKFNLTNMP